MKDIENRKDIEFLVDEFYKHVVKDDTIGFFFTNVVPVDWAKHMPIMYSFWETLILGNGDYRGNPMLKHISLNRKEKMLPKHFDKWLELWETTIKANFKGENAIKALQKAQQIGGLMKFKVQTT
ncbi:group III truncated hemoglobin [Lutibacter sp. TH_r2]|uniref:group III truncated hemoglobin n=1 Tax=Lutibacter sp. TH_r2 TaxID=3082083 RepID=UPI0029554E22|nr:group III truncated hemoglobin [Lutibacter sp. TH_r2]MDV7188277.1 group III truncated hemoglobin [Lutibacter sp. TH_r2]